MCSSMRLEVGFYSGVLFSGSVLFWLRVVYGDELIWSLDLGAEMSKSSQSMLWGYILKQDVEKVSSHGNISLQEDNQDQ